MIALEIILLILGYLLIGAITAISFPFFVWTCCRLEDNESLYQVYKEWFKPCELGEEVYVPVFTFLLRISKFYHEKSP